MSLLHVMFKSVAGGSTWPSARRPRAPGAALPSPCRTSAPTAGRRRSGVQGCTFTPRPHRTRTTGVIVLTNMKCVSPSMIYDIQRHCCLHWCPQASGLRRVYFCSCLLCAVLRRASLGATRSSLLGRMARNSQTARSLQAFWLDACADVRLLHFPPRHRSPVEISEFHAEQAHQLDKATHHIFAAWGQVQGELLV